MAWRSDHRPYARERLRRNTTPKSDRERAATSTDRYELRRLYESYPVEAASNAATETHILLYILGSLRSTDLREAQDVLEAIAGNARIMLDMLSGAPSADTAKVLGEAFSTAIRLIVDRNALGDVTVDHAPKSVRSFLRRADGSGGVFFSEFADYEPYPSAIKVVVDSHWPDGSVPKDSPMDQLRSKASRLVVADAVVRLLRQEGGVMETLIVPRLLELARGLSVVQVT